MRVSLTKDLITKVKNIEPLHQDPATIEQFAQFHREMRDWHTHVNLQNDLVEHVWDHIGNQ